MSSATTGPIWFLATDNPTGKNWVSFIRDLQKPPVEKPTKVLGTWKGNNDKDRDLTFLRLIAKEYFRVVGSAQREFARSTCIR